MKTSQRLKTRVQKEINSRRDELTALSLLLHSNPELSLNEILAAEWLGDYLEKAGLKTVCPAYGLRTAFEATYGNEGPNIGIIAEYDALPDIGHACGHNIIGTAALAAGIAIKPVIDEVGGTVHVIGTPGEEGKGGKIIMAKKGAFDKLDAAMMIHPGSYNSTGCLAMGVAVLEVEYFGRAAHAAATPYNGINALEAMIQAFNAINSLRQHTRDGSRIHGIITEGGAAPNIIPAYTAGTFYVRSMDDEYLEELKNKVIECFKGSAKSTGCKLSYRWGKAQYSTMRNNRVMSGLYGENIGKLGRVIEPYNDKTFGSTDMGNVSQLVPSIHPIIAVSPTDVAIHTNEFETYSASEFGHQAIIDGAIAMAWTVVDLLTESNHLRDANEAFKVDEVD